MKRVLILVRPNGRLAVPIAMTQEQQALQASLRDWAKRAGPLAVVRAMEPRDGHRLPPAGTTLLTDLAVLGVFALPVDGGTVTDVAAALEELACALVPGPVLPTLLTTLILSRHASGQPAVRELLGALAQGRAAASVALTPGPLTGTRQPDGSLRVSGETAPVLWAAGHLLVPAATVQGDTWFLADPGQAGVTVTGLTPVDFSRELAAITFDDVTVPPDQVLNGLDTGRVRDLAATLHAAEAAGVAAWCSATAAGYAGTRRQFGRLIGEFQAVKHLCATLACRAERAAALAWDAARAADQAPAEHPLAAAAAAALALDDAVANAKDCIQVLGGIGFTWEHDAHLYLRRALALRQLLGGSAPWRIRAAELAASGARRQVGPVLPEAEASPYPGIGAWAGPAIEAHGTEPQRDRFLGPTRRAEIAWCQLFSEPEAGSDLASLRTRAEPAEGGWRLTGQKVWTSLARQADWAICLARTDPAVPKHQGVTFFLVDMHAPGLDIRPLREITGRAVFNEVFLDEVFVPDSCVLGEPGDGWRIAMSTLATERTAIGGGRALDEAVERLLAAGAAASPLFAERTGVHVAGALAVALLGVRATHPAIRKLIGTEHRQAVAETVLELQGPAGAAAGEASYEFLLTRCLSIAGGTTQILLNQVAERVLGLPR
jgi:3-oxochol-4-en-24-oyl-CoA dehydrogenase